MFEGTIVWFDPKKGYGFIDWDKKGYGFEDDGKDLFLHFSDLAMEGFKTVKKGQRVRFSLGENNRGQPKATEVVLVD